MTGPLGVVIPLLVLTLPVGIAFYSHARDWRRDQAVDRMARIGILTTTYPTSNQDRLCAYTAKRAGLLTIGPAPSFLRRLLRAFRKSNPNPRAPLTRWQDGRNG